MSFAGLFYMKKNKPVALIISASSDIGKALSLRWKSAGWHIYGTYRSKTESVDELIAADIPMFPCDLVNAESIKSACDKLRKKSGKWDILVLCAGTLEPIGGFNRIDFSKW